MSRKCRIIVALSRGGCRRSVARATVAAAAHYGSYLTDTAVEPHESRMCDCRPEPANRRRYDTCNSVLYKALSVVSSLCLLYKEL